MGVTINLNYIIRQDFKGVPVVAKEYKFKKKGRYLITDDIPIWLTRKNWTPLAEIQVISQTRENEETKGKFLVRYVYTKEEQKVLRKIFRRLYGWG